jgi:hypothetical protein
MQKPATGSPSSPPKEGEYRLRERVFRGNSQKKAYRLQQFVRRGWVNREFVLEWFPRHRTWRAIRSEFVETGEYWRSITIADLGDVSAEHACSVFVPTLQLAGYICD